MEEIRSKYRRSLATYFERYLFKSVSGWSVKKWLRQKLERFCELLLSFGGMRQAVPRRVEQRNLIMQVNYLFKEDSASNSSEFCLGKDDLHTKQENDVTINIKSAPVLSLTSKFPCKNTPVLHLYTCQVKCKSLQTDCIHIVG